MAGHDWYLDKLKDFTLKIKVSVPYVQNVQKLMPYIYNLHSFIRNRINNPMQEFKRVITMYDRKLVPQGQTKNKNKIIYPMKFKINFSSNEFEIGFIQDTFKIENPIV